jgi:hypothetical protein
VLTSYATDNVHDAIVIAPSSYLSKFFDKTKSMTPPEIADYLEGDDEVRTPPSLLRVGSRFHGIIHNAFRHGSWRRRTVTQRRPASQRYIDADLEGCCNAGIGG